MNCQDFRQHLQQLLDGQTVRDPLPFEQHSAECADCAGSYRAAVALGRGLKLLSPAAVPSRLSDRIVDQLLNEHRTLIRLRTRRRWSMAVAAGILLCRVGGFLSLNRTRPTSEPLARAPGQTGNEVSLAVRAEPTLLVNQSLADARSALTSLVSQTAGEAIDSGRLL